MSYFERIEGIASGDVDGLRVSNESYGDSWKKRGGANAFFMLCRKFDRIERQVERYSHDIFTAVYKDNREEGILDDIRDLRRYLLLVEAHVRNELDKSVVDNSEPEAP